MVKGSLWPGFRARILMLGLTFGRVVEDEGFRFADGSIAPERAGDTGNLSDIQILYNCNAAIKALYRAEYEKIADLTRARAARARLAA